MKRLFFQVPILVDNFCLKFTICFCLLYTQPVKLKQPHQPENLHNSVISKELTKSSISTFEQKGIFDQLVFEDDKSVIREWGGLRICNAAGKDPNVLSYSFGFYSPQKKPRNWRAFSFVLSFITWLLKKLWLLYNLVWKECVPQLKYLGLMSILKLERLSKVLNF